MFYRDVLQGTSLHLSINCRHIWYTCDCWPVDFGAAVILYQGKVEAMHQEGISHIQELIRHKQDMMSGLMPWKSPYSPSFKAHYRVPLDY